MSVEGELLCYYYGSRMVGGIEFYKVGPETAKLRCPNVVVVDWDT